MQRFTSRLQSRLQFVRRHPVRWALIFGSLVLVVGAVPFFWPKTVEFSYADQTCTKELTLLPKLHQQTTDTSYQVDFVDTVELAGVSVLSKSVCFTPTDRPGQGEVRLATALWGSWLAPQIYNMQVGAEPQVDVAALKQPVPTTKPISVSLDQPDSLHTYQLAVGKNTTDCNDDDTELSCDIEKFNLDQGKQYKYQLTRQFSGQPAEPISDGTIETLKAVKITKSSVKNDQIVYSKPTSFTFKTDKPIQGVEATLKSGKTSIVVETEIDDKSIRIKAAGQLDRETDYQLILDQVEATDGSTLVEPYEVKFTMSGGPKVANVSIGSSRVDANARALITFDQDLSAEQDIAKLVAIKGGEATISRAGERQVVVQLNNLGRCIPFTLTVAPGVLSKHDIKQDDSWNFKSRTICYTTSVYGTSLQGRPLIAYHFGNSGPVTLYTGAIHGNEISSMYMMQSWIAELEANPDKIGSRQIVVIPNINPDGVTAGTRNNSRNVNLSRNFPTDNWVKDIDDTDGHNKGGGGSKPFSEPEAAALARFTENLRPRLLLSYHAVGSLVVGDGHGTYSGGKAAQYAGLVGYRNATGESGTFDYDITGAFEDWTYRNRGIPSMVIELGSYVYHDFNSHRAAMWAMLD